MRSAHDVHAWVLIGANAAVGVWALAAHQWPGLRHRVLWIAVILAQLTTVVQAGLGVGVSRADDIEIDDMHMLYGVSATDPFTFAVVPAMLAAVAAAASFVPARRAACTDPMVSLRQ